MRDISQLSNEELLRQAQNLDVISQASPSLTQLSNEELLRQAQQAGITPVSQPQAPGMGEAFGRGLLQGGKRGCGWCFISRIGRCAAI
jgi:hypothetical protein